MGTPTHIPPAYDYENDRHSFISDPDMQRKVTNNANERNYSVIKGAVNQIAI